ncbi:helix-turn-helix domain-containing protein [Streptomyces sp. NPDC021224]|jgi:excisionase family DNA binding protein|uniref:helix-turn-helix domain-containing protein n=1 Tax=unclassified Streptomyces TaxID=2593676 RepID=UPI0037A81D86
MPEIPLPIALLADAIGVTQQDLLRALHASTSAAHDPTLVALTPEEAARRLSVGRTTLFALIASGEIPSVKIGRSRRVPAEALNDYVVARAQLTRSTVALAA